MNKVIDVIFQEDHSHLNTLTQVFPLTLPDLTSSQGRVGVYALCLTDIFLTAPFDVSRRRGREH